MEMVNSSTTYPYPGVHIEELNGTPPIEGVNPSVAAFIGLTRRGPANKPVKIFSFAEYEKIFGGLVKEYHLGYCVQHFFLNSGTACYIIRVQPSNGRRYVSDSTIVGEVGRGESGGTGMRSLDNIDSFNLLCIPPYNKKNSVSITVYRKALKYCERRRAILLIDPPYEWTRNNPSRKPDSKKLEKIVGGLRHPNAAMFYPRIRANDPIDNKIRTFVPSAAVAGVIARTDSTSGVWKAPEGLHADIKGVTELESTLTDEENGQLNKLGVNCLRVVPPTGIVIWGSRTLVKEESNSEFNTFWKYLPVRRLALFIEESLYRGTQWAAFEPNDESLWSKIHMSVGNFMHGLFRNGAFQGTKPSEAYFIKCDSETTTQDDREKGIVNIIVGFAPLKPAEFVIIKIQQIVKRNSNRSRISSHGPKNRK